MNEEVMNYSLKCYDCMHLIREFGDEPSLGGGCDNVVRCVARPEVEEMIRKELKYFGNNGSPFGSWLCGQTGVDVSTEVYSDNKDEWETKVESLRDPAWEAVDEWLDYLPKITLKDLDSKWMLRKEDQIAEDVLWRAQKGRCYDYCERPDEMDVLLFSSYLQDEKVAPFDSSFDISPEEEFKINDEYCLIQEAESPESILTGHFSFAPAYGFFSNRVFHSAA